MTTPEENKPETTASEAGEKSFLSNLWRSRAMTPLRVAFWAASPVWWPTKMAVKTGLWGLQRESTAAKVLTPMFAAAALATYLGAASYTAMYGVVAAGENYWFGQPYDSGRVTGTISSLRVVGKFPCNTVEGQLALRNLTADGSSTFPFSARNMAWLNSDVIAKLQDAYDHQYPVDLEFERTHFPREWFNPENEGWWLPHISGFNCYQKTDTNIIGARRAAGTQNPEPPKLIPGQ